MGVSVRLKLTLWAILLLVWGSQSCPFRLALSSHHGVCSSTWKGRRNAQRGWQSVGRREEETSAKNQVMLLPVLSSTETWAYTVEITDYYSALRIKVYIIYIYILYIYKINTHTSHVWEAVNTVPLLLNKLLINCEVILLMNQVILSRLMRTSLWHSLW